MSEHYSNTIPGKPEGWTMADEGYEKVTRIDYYGEPYEVWQQKQRGLNLGQLWEKWRRDYPWNGGGSDHTKRQQTLIDIENNQL